MDLTKSRQFLPLASLFLFGFASSSLAFVVAPSPEDAFLITYSTLALVALLVPVAIETTINIFHPLCFFAASVFLGTTARAYFLVFSNGEGKNSLLLNQPASAAMPGALLILLGCCCISLGYLISLTNPQKPWRLSRSADNETGNSWSGFKVSWLTLLMLGISIGVLFFIFLETSGDFSSFSLDQLRQMRRMAINASNSQDEYWALSDGLVVANCVRYAFYMCLICFVTTPPRSLWKFIVCLLTGSLALLVPLFSSSRAQMISIVVAAMIILSWSRTLRTRYVIITGVIGVAAFCVMDNFRQLRDRPLDSLTFEEALNSIMATHNYVDITKYSHLIDATPDRLPYLYGLSYLTWAAAPIPTSIWPDKPLLTNEIELTEILYGGQVQATGIEFGGTPMGLIAEGYRNYGLIGTVLASTIYGMAISYFYRRFNYGDPVTHNSKLIYVSMYAILTFFVSDIEFSRVVIEFFASISVSLFFILLVTDRSRRPLEEEADVPITTVLTS